MKRNMALSSLEAPGEKPLLDRLACRRGADRHCGWPRSSSTPAGNETWVDGETCVTAGWVAKRADAAYGQSVCGGMYHQVIPLLGCSAKRPILEGSAVTAGPSTGWHTAAIDSVARNGCAGVPRMRRIPNVRSGATRALANLPREQSGSGESAPGGVSFLTASGGWERFAPAGGGDLPARGSKSYHPCWSHVTIIECRLGDQGTVLMIHLTCRQIRINVE